MKQIVPVQMTPAVAIPVTLPMNLDPAARKRAANSNTLMQKRAALAFSEPEDAMITGMTRSLDRRLLALNLGSKVPAALSFLSAADRKIA